MVSTFGPFGLSFESSEQIPHLQCVKAGRVLFGRTLLQVRNRAIWHFKKIVMNTSNFRFQTSGNENAKRLVGRPIE